VTPGAARDDDALLRMEGITKRFAGATALDAVDFALQAGEVHALVGENGAGKSTLVKIMTGAYRRDAGAMWLGGLPARFDTPAAAQAAGVVAVHQEIHLLRYRTVAENVCLGREPRRFGLVDWRAVRREAERALAALGPEAAALGIDPRATLGALNTARQQMVAIARGVSLGARVLVLDEPTSSLADREVALLYDVVRRLRASGVGVVYISHRFDELYALCDRVTVLRDGRLVATRPLAGLERVDLVALMLGKTRDAVRAGGATGFGHRPAPPAGAADAAAPLLDAEHLSRGRRLRDVSVRVRPGEIVGLAGLLGSGRSETARALFGAEPAEGGTARLAGRPFAPRRPDDAIAAGVAYLSEDRKAEGIIPELSVRENLTLAALPALTRAGVVSRARQRALVDGFVRRLGIRARSADQPVRELSGGNQQKVLIARCLATNPKLLLLDEPTRGVDVGAKAEIQGLVRELAESGLGVLMASSELEELVEGCTRVVVLRDGRSVAELAGGAVEPDAIMDAMAHGAAAADAAAGGEVPA
jgi:ribose transport system ATP-binding protein